MEKLFSRILGTPIVDDGGGRPISSVKDLVIDPENGRILAFKVDLVRNLIVSEMDVLGWGIALRIHNNMDIIDANEVLRVDEVLRSGTKIFRNKVYTKEGEFLGKVFDYTVDTKAMSLKKIFVAKGLLGIIRYDSRTFDYKDIEEILTNKIVVKESMRKIKEKETQAATDLAAAG
ncbi:PRC-barrel domain-containing protein [Patescibacteria group bacterium]|nr:PRC-barrel domain-containing protein [Patescibacteria group bacterium]